MTTSIFKINATVTSDINLYYIKRNLLRSTIILTGIKILYQSLESIIRIIISSFINLNKIRLTRRIDVNFVYMLLKNVTENNTGKGLLHIVNINRDLQL